MYEGLLSDMRAWSAWGGLQQLLNRDKIRHELLGYQVSIPGLIQTIEPWVRCTLLGGLPPNHLTAAQVQDSEGRRK